MIISFCDFAWHSITRNVSSFTFFNFLGWHFQDTLVSSKTPLFGHAFFPMTRPLFWPIGLNFLWKISRSLSINCWWEIGVMVIICRFWIFGVAAIGVHKGLSPQTQPKSLPTGFTCWVNFYLEIIFFMPHPRIQKLQIYIFCSFWMAQLALRQSLLN